MGRQFADDSMTPPPIADHDDEYKNCIPTDRPMHENTTPGMGAFNWDAGHYATDFSSYGKQVASVAPSKVTVDVNPHAANRGDES